MNKTTNEGEWFCEESSRSEMLVLHHASGSALLEDSMTDANTDGRSKQSGAVQIVFFICIVFFWSSVWPEGRERLLRLEVMVLLC